jgi:hypothetical protein
MAADARTAAELARALGTSLAFSLISVIASIFGTLFASIDTLSALLPTLRRVALPALMAVGGTSLATGMMYVLIARGRRSAQRLATSRELLKAAYGRALLADRIGSLTSSDTR